MDRDTERNRDSDGDRDPGTGTGETERGISREQIRGKETEMHRQGERERKVAGSRPPLTDRGAFV